MKEKSLAPILVLAVLVVFLATGFTEATEEERSISIPHRVEVSRLNIKLGEIASITGEDSFRQQVEDIELGRAPLPDYSRSLYREVIIDELRGVGIDVSQLEINIPYQFQVVSDYRNLAIQDLIATGEEYIYDNLPYSSEEMEIDPISPPQEIRIPKGEIEYLVESNTTNLLGTTMLPLKIKVDGQVYRQLYLRYRVSLYTETLVAKEGLDRGQALSRDLFSLEKREITNQHNRVVDPEIELEGKELTRSLRAGEVLQRNMVQEPALVERWEEVTLIARVNKIKVTTKGQALEEGRRGEIISVRNESTGERIRGEVVSEDKVEVIIN